MNLVAAASDPRAISSLEVFAAAPHRLLALVTRPDRPKGRGRKAEESELVAWAKGKGTPVLQPDDINACLELEALAPDVVAVIAYGQKLGPRLLAMPKHGCLNLHPSLLPKYRGAAPIPRAILGGEAQTGVCILRMVDRMDAGPILASAKEDIRADDTAETLGERLFLRGAGLFREVLDRLPMEGTPQDEALATRAPMLSKEDGLLDLAKDPALLERQVRALQPWPGAYLLVDGKRLKVWKARVSPQGDFELLEVQAEGKRRMPYSEYRKGLR